MRRLLLLYACISSLAASAAIITERNDVYHSIGYGDLGCYTPPQYTFVGSASVPGIESCWIPYGTYTGGTGSVEYVRVTDHLMGVVASALAGLSERAQHSPFMLRPIGIPNRYRYWTDDGAFLESTTNLSLRIADQFNLPLMYVSRNGTNYTYTVTSRESNCLEPRILECAEYFGSRRLESLITAQGHSIEPPISSEWSTDLPYKVSDTNLWRYVYPVLGYCTNDIHFLPAGGIGQGSWNAFPYGFSVSPLESIWGNDVVQGYWDVVWGTDGNPLPFTIEDVLSYDTGWKYEVPPKLTNDYWTVNGRRLNRDFVDGAWDDLPNSYYALWSFVASNFIYRIYWIPPDDWQYEVRTNPEEDLVSLTYTYDQPTSTLLYFEDGTVATKTELFASQDDYNHWRNGTTRLDWKRLGIICQLERQMEQTYRRSDNEDYLPFQEVHAHHGKSGTTPILKSLPIPNQWEGQSEYVSLSNVTWTLTESRSSSTNELGWSYPTVRTPKPSFSYGPGVDGVDCGGLTITWGDFTNRLYEALSSHDEITSYFIAYPIIHLGDEPLSVGVDFEIVYSDYAPIENFGFFWSSQDLFPDASETNYELSVRCDIGKSAHVRYTTSREDQERAILERLDPHPNTNTWNRSYVARQTRPTLEIMIAAAGDHARADVGGDDLFDPLPWDAIKDISVSERFFRMNPLCAEATTKGASDYNRLEMLRNLDCEIKDKCVELGGLDVSMAHHVADMKPEEEAAMIRGVQTAGAYLEFGMAYNEKFIGVDSTNTYLFAMYAIDGSGNFHVWGAETWTTNGNYQIDSDTPIYLGSYGWRETSHPDSVPSYTGTGRYENVRVDGHQNQMIKTLWRFKNLRDPNL